MRTGELREDLSISVLKANVYSVLLVSPPVAGLALLHIALWEPVTLLLELPATPLGLLRVVGVMVLGIVAHELLHGFTWVLASGKRLSAVEFGIQWKVLTPYAHCREPIEVGAYRAGVVMPGFVLGILPAALGLITGGGVVVLFGMFFVLAAGGDFLILLLVRKVPAGSLVEDHPVRPGCYVQSYPYSSRQ